MNLAKTKVIISFTIRIYVNGRSIIQKSNEEKLI